MVNYLERQGIGRTLASSFVFISIGVVLSLLGLWLFPHFAETVPRLQADMPRLITGVSQFISELESRVQSVSGPLSNFDLEAKVESQLTEWTRGIFTAVPGYVKTFFTVMLLGPFLAFFMVKDGRASLSLILGIVPNELFETALSLLHQINFQIGQFVRARIIESLIVGLVTSAGLILIGFPYAILLGVVAAVTNLIPYIGPLIGALPAFAMALVNGNTTLEVFFVATVYIVAQLIDAGILIPMLVAKIVDLHPVTVIIVIIAGAQVMGILGMIISIPVASTLKVTVSTIYRHLIDTRS
jgi:putative permease